VGCDAAQELTQAMVDYGVLIDSGEFSGLASQDAIRRMAEHAEAHAFGAKTVSYRLKDWGISRQRLWGTPIPIICCDRCGAVPVPEQDLPVLLPRVDRILLGGSPLAAVPEFVNATCPECGRAARRETDTMDTFVDSSWYFYRYTDPRVDSAPVSREVLRYWFPVDIYIGGIEHAVLHLIYMRFFGKVMRDLGLIEFDEPVTRLFTQGMVIKDGAKMSKSLGNVVEPDEIVREYGADSLRLFIQFAAPPDGDLEWSEQGLEGCFRFLNRVWRLVFRAQGKLAAADTQAPAQGDWSDREKALIRKLHQTIRKVGQDIERMRQNTAVAAIMELLNALQDAEEQGGVRTRALVEGLEKLTLLLRPFAPHFAEAVWERLGHTGALADVSWPEYDPELAREEEIEIVVQINGKVRGRFVAPVGLSDADMEALAMKDVKVGAALEGKSVRKVVIVPGKLVNIVAG
jgi:leucyl-tRNA synthetase